MRFALLSTGNGWHVRDLQRAAVQLNHEAVAVDFRRIRAGVGAGVDSLSGFDGIMVRTMPPGSLEQVVFRMDVLHRVRAAGVPVLNPPAAVEACVDKYLATARLAAAGLPVPSTIVCQHADAAMEAFVTLGSDVVVKPIFGSEGRGMMRIADADLAWRTFRTLERLQSVLYLQRFIPHAGWDLRAFVLSGRVVAAMRRRSNGGWRTNIAQGGSGEKVQLADQDEGLAIRAAAALGAPAAGVDILPDQDGKRHVLEVNAVPGWRALSAVTDIDVAALLLRFLAVEYRLG
jgi:RimK family alpha-L-glutamate ligase